MLDKGRDAGRPRESRPCDPLRRRGQSSISPLDRARQVNVEGTRNVLRLATALEQAGRLRRVDYIGTAFVAGDSSRPRLRGAAARAASVPQLVRTVASGKPRASYASTSRTSRSPSTGRASSSATRRAGYTTSFSNVVLAAQAARVRAPCRSRRSTSGESARCRPRRFRGRGVQRACRLRDLAREMLPPGCWTGRAECAPAICWRRRPGSSRSRSRGVIPPQLAFGLLRPVLNAVLWGKRREMLAKAESYLPYFAYHASFDTSDMATSELEPLGIRPPQVVDYFRNLLRYSLDSGLGTSAARRGAGFGEARAAGRGAETAAVAPPPAATLFARLTSVLELFTKRVDPSDPANPGSRVHPAWSRHHLTSLAGGTSAPRARTPKIFRASRGIHRIASRQSQRRAAPPRRVDAARLCGDRGREPSGRPTRWSTTSAFASRWSTTSS